MKQILRKHHTCLLLVIFSMTMQACSGSKKSSTSEAPAAGSASAEWLKTYSDRMGIRLPATINQQLVTTVSEWLGVPYKYGGTTKSGVDCSGFIGNVYPKVYGIPVARTTQALYSMASPTAAANLRDGDLVFFRIDGAKVSHAGIYLCNDYFIHASTSKGVMVSSLTEPYWKKYFVAAGRLVP